MILTDLQPLRHVCLSTTPPTCPFTEKPMPVTCQTGTPPATPTRLLAIYNAIHTANTPPVNTLYHLYNTLGTFTPADQSTLLTPPQPCSCELAHNAG